MAKSPSDHAAGAGKAPRPLPYTLERADLLGWELLPGRTPMHVQAARLSWYGVLIFGMGFMEGKSFIEQIIGAPFILALDWGTADTREVILSAAMSFGLFMLWYSIEQLVRLSFLNWRVNRALANHTGTRRVEITPEGITESVDAATTTYAWDKIPYSFCTNLAAYILLSQTSRIIVPQRAFKSSKDMTRFIEIIEQRSHQATP